LWPRGDTAPDPYPRTPRAEYPVRMPTVKKAEVEVEEVAWGEEEGEGEGEQVLRLEGCILHKLFCRRRA